MTSHCDSNPAQYERNRRFGHLVHALGRETSGAKLPSVGLRLNASKSESRLSIAMISRALAAFAGIVRGGTTSAASAGTRFDDAARATERSPVAEAECNRCSFALVMVLCCSVKSFVDDSGTCRGVVHSRAATTLRSIEAQPMTGRFVCLHQLRGTLPFGWPRSWVTGTVDHNV